MNRDRIKLLTFEAADLGSLAALLAEKSGAAQQQVPVAKVRLELCAGRDVEKVSP